MEKAIKAIKRLKQLPYEKDLYMECRWHIARCVIDNIGHIMLHTIDKMERKILLFLSQNTNQSCG